jgi:hypothetical protein
MNIPDDADDLMGEEENEKPKVYQKISLKIRKFYSYLW